MRHIYISIFALIAVLLVSVVAVGQPLSGYYYVGARLGSAPGGADPDFADLKAVQSRLRDTTNGGVAGPTTFYLLDTSYTLGTSATLSRIQYKGGSPTNTVRIKPYTSMKPTINFPTKNVSSTGQLQFGDESFMPLCPQYFTIDGSNTESGTTKDLTFNFTGQVGIRMFCNSNHITIKNCIINGTYDSTNTSNVVSISMQYRTAAPVGYFYPDSCVVENCEINHFGGSAGGGISLNRGSAPANLNVGTTGVILRNNIIRARDRGISVEHAINAQIYGNTIRVNQNSTRTSYGIYFLRTAGTTTQTSNIYNNKIDSLATMNASTGNGINGIFVGNLATGTTNIYNNFITGFSTPSSLYGYASGVYIDSVSSADVNVYHNSIHVPVVLLTDSVYGIFVRNTAGSPNVTVKNNIIAVYENDDTSYCLAKVGTAGSFVSDRNVLYAGGGAIVGNWQGTELATLANWQTTSSQDANSKSVNPAATFGGAGQWKSATDLHFFSKPANAFGAPQVGGITKDIDGDTRGTPAYIGADEISGSPLLAVRYDQSVPHVFELSNNYPNPFNPSTLIRYSIAKTCNVTLAVHNLLGQRIATLVNEVASPGAYSVQWHGKSDTGLQAAGGVYFYTFRAGDFAKTQSMVLLK